jgi:signal transduction histidine kinase
VVAFHLPAPLWQRPWFVALLAGTLSGLAWNAWRVRRRRTRALAAIRTRIARDLHDEVGSNLAQIAVLAEVARREPPGPVDRLGEIAELARGTRSSMADLVWAIDPRRDTLLELVQRMRAVTSNLLDGGAVELELRVPPEHELDGLALAPDQRRHLLLFFKEALHNVERHAAARHVEVELACAPRRLTLCVRDDGRGFDPAQATTGQGLASLRARARELGATLRIESSPAQGTSIELELAL